MRLTNDKQIFYSTGHNKEEFRIYAEASENFLANVGCEVIPFLLKLNRQEAIKLSEELDNFISYSDSQQYNLKLEN